LIGIFNGYAEIERWLSELHEDYVDSSVSISAVFYEELKGRHAHST
jgi:hypothetical protein